VRLARRLPAPIVAVGFVLCAALVQPAAQRRLKPAVPLDPVQTIIDYGFEMNVRGVLHACLNYNGRTLFKPFDATGVTIATALRGSLSVRTDTDHGWSLEAMIPWPDFAQLARRPRAAGRYGRPTSSAAMASLPTAA
jgi:hypothetical protein